MNTRATSPSRTVRRLRVDHETRYDYEDGVEIAHHLAHLRPRQTEGQRIRDWTLLVDPPPDNADASDAARQTEPAAGIQRGVRLSTDGWGNWRACFSHARVHDALSVRSTFIAEVLPEPMLQPDRSPRWESVVDLMGYRPGIAPIAAAEFALPTRLAG